MKCGTGGVLRLTPHSIKNDRRQIEIDLATPSHSHNSRPRSKIAYWDYRHRVSQPYATKLHARCKADAYSFPAADHARSIGRATHGLGRKYAPSGTSTSHTESAYKMRLNMHVCDTRIIVTGPVRSKEYRQTKLWQRSLELI